MFLVVLSLPKKMILKPTNNRSHVLKNNMGFAIGQYATALIPC